MINTRRNAPSFGDFEWFCCLHCRLPPQNTAVTYYVSECGHIICSNCKTIAEDFKSKTPEMAAQCKEEKFTPIKQYRSLSKPAKKDECGECKKQKPQYKQLAENFVNDPKIGVYFSNVTGMAQKIVKLLEFQAYHMRRSSLLPENRVIDIPPSFYFLNNVDTHKLQETWMAEMKYITNLNYQFQQLMGMMKYITKAGVSLVEAMSLEMKYEGMVCCPADLIISVRPQQHETGRDSMSTMHENCPSRPSPCGLPPPPPPYTAFGNGSTPRHFGNSGYNNKSVGQSQVSDSLHMKNRGTPTLSPSSTSPFITPKGRSTRLSVMPPPSNGKLGF